MQISVVNGRPNYTSIIGTVYLSGLASSFPIGTFTATRVP